MRKRAEHDALTGLLNRAEYEMRIDHFFHENENPLGIFIILDIDNFKAINDTFGHVTGDQVLYAVGEHLRNLFPETTHIARIGGDEFSLFIPYVLPLAQLHTKMSSLCHPITLPVENITLACSAGVCYSPQNGMNHNDLYRNADMALNTQNFEAGTREYIRQYVCAEDVESMLSKFTLKNILNQLDTHQTYSLFYSSKSPDGQLQKKQLRFNYINCIKHFGTGSPVKSQIHNL